MMSFFRKVRGSVSLILIFVMFPMLTQATLIVDGIRLSSAKTAVSGAGDLTMNTALATYDRALQDIYGMFAMCENMEDLQTTFQAYFSNTLSGNLTKSGVPEGEVRNQIDNITTTVMNNIFGNGDFNNEELGSHIAMDMMECTVKGNTSATLANPAVLKTQIVEYMKYKAPIMLTTGILDQMHALADSKSQTDAVNKQVQYTENLKTLQEKCENAVNSIYAFNDKVIEIDKATKQTSDKTTEYIDKLFTTGGVKTNLSDATKNLLYYKNLWQYWKGENPIFLMNDFVVKGVKDLDCYGLDTDSNNRYSTKLKNDNKLSSDGTVNSKYNNILDSLNTEYYTNDNGDTILLKNYNYNTYEKIIAQEATLISAYNKMEACKQEHIDAYNALTSISSDGFEYVNEFHNYIAKYPKSKLEELCTYSEYYTSCYSTFINTYNSLVESVKNETKRWGNYRNDPYKKDELGYDERLQYESYMVNLSLLYNLSQQVIFGDDSVKDEKGNTQQKILAIQTADVMNSWKDMNSSCVSKDLRSQLGSAITKCEKYRDSYYTAANDNFKNAWEYINKFKDNIAQAETLSNTVSTNLTDVKNTAAEVKKSHETWGNAIEKTPEGSTKTTMETTHAAEGEKIIPEEIEALIKFADGQKNAYKALNDYLNKIQYFGKSVCGEQLNADTFVKNASEGTWYGTYNSDTNLSPINEETALNITNSCMDKYYKLSSGEKVGMSESVKKNAVIPNGNNFVQFGYRTEDAKEGRSGYPYNLFFTDKDELAKTFYTKLLNYTKTTGKQGNGDTAKSDVQNQITNNKGSNTTPNSIIESAKPSDVATIQQIFNDINSAGASDSENTKGIGSVGGSANDIGTLNKDTDAGNYKNNLSASSNYLQNLMDLIEKGIEKIINYAYMEEYFTNMFSCYTTNKDNGSQLTDVNREKTLEGIILCAEHNLYYQYEQEYILWGGDPKTALNKTLLTVFGIRFALNTIYAFTSSEIQAIACQIATAIAGWTVFGVPVVQAIITMVFSLAESGIDLMELCEGKSVPIYKSSSTWRCSISGLTNYAIEKTIDTATEKANDFLTEFASGQIDNIQTSFNEYITGQVDSAGETLKNSIGSVISAAATQCYAAAGAETKAESIKEIADKSIKNLQTTLKNDTSNPVSIAASAGLDALIAEHPNFVGEICDSVVSEIKTAGDDAVAAIQKTVYTKVDGFVKGINDKITNAINNQADELKKSVNSAIKDETGKISDAAKDKIQTELDKYTGKKSTSGLAKNGVDSKDTSKSIEMNYKQYVKIFMLVGLMTNQNDMLKRCAALMQANMSHIKKAEDIGNVTKFTVKDINMKSAFTLVEMDASVAIPTIFNYDMDVSGSDGSDTGLYNNLKGLWSGEGEAQMNYHSVMGF